ncbi:uncharacterized protein UBRO2_03577 [Ustilago bromivora]|uniref:Adenylate cyclase n=1 Tax=Ustilago bromivora TaxID=307758 RepID=A0A8H8QNB0_9BASI|nr:uncharacterized protein UBRO2_03577 [Ustilago bromivora]
MSAAVRAALAVKRAEARSRSVSPSKPHLTLPNDDNERPHFGRELDASIASPFGSPKPAARAVAATADRSSDSPILDMNLNQKSEEAIVRLSVENGKVNLSSREPSLQQVPALLLSLLSDDPPSWFLQIPQDDRQPWYMREEVHTLQLSNNQLESLPDNLAHFRGLKRLELHSNRLSTLPTSFFQLTALTTLTLSKNALTSVPQCLLALDNLVTLNLSYNKIQTLWKREHLVSARSQRDAWDKENATQENGVWAGLSPSKKDRRPLNAASQTPSNAPMRSLRTLDLSHNRITNAALGIPDLANRRNKANDSTASDNIIVQLPAGLRTLNLGFNNIRGPVSVSLFQQLESLEDLGLQGCGIADHVFAVQNASESSKATFPSLCVLDLSGCELDDLAKMEALFGSSRIQSFDQVMGNVDTAQQPAQDNAEPVQGMPARQLVRVPNRPTSSNIDGMQDRCNAKVLCLLLEGNPLREEAFRQKRGGRSAASPEKKAVPTATVNVPAAPSQAASVSSAIATSAASASTAATTVTAGSSQLPSKSQVVKEEWEILAESGLNTELGRRKLRIEQARREQEAAAATTKGADRSNTETETRGRKPRAADDATSSDPDAATSGGESQERASGDAIDDKDSGSALANAKLSSKKKEALGQPMSMDRKNKKAAQHGQPLPQVSSQPQQQMAGGAQAGQRGGIPQQQQQQGGQAKPGGGQRQVLGQQGQPQQMAMPQHGTLTRNTLVPGQAASSQLPSSFRDRKTSLTTRDHDLPFGVPDDLHGSAPNTADPGRAGFEGISVGSAGGHAQGQNLSASFAGSSSFRRPGSLSQSFSASLAAQSFGGMDSAAAAFGTSASASRAFGTSPFSHPSGHALFFSGSQDSEGGAGPFARNNRDVFGARSIGRMDDAAKLWGGIPASAGGPSFAQPIGGSKEEEEIEDAEDFLPSSLSDLLTPAELERRRCSNRLSSSFAGDSERITVAQSMPSHAGGAFGTSLGFARSAIGAERVKPSNLSTGFAQQQQHQMQQQGAQDYSPFGTSSGRRTSGLDSIAFRQSSSGLSTSDSRTAAHHAPGQSLPQGLAAGLSRLHLRTGRTAADGSSGNLASGGVGSIGPAVSNDALSVGGGVFATGSFTQAGNSGLRVPGSLDDYGLGPTAPSSVLPHRSPLSFAANPSPSAGGSRLSSSFSDRNGGSVAGSPFSPPMNAIGSHRTAGEGGKGGIAIPEVGAGQKQVGVGGYAQHPATQRLRAGSSAAAPHSPLTLPVVTAEEDGEEAIFELE